MVASCRSDWIGKRGVKHATGERRQEKCSASERVVSNMLPIADVKTQIAESTQQLHCMVGEFGRVSQRNKLRVKVVMKRERVAFQVDIGVNSETVQAVSSFKRLGKISVQINIQTNM